MQDDAESYNEGFLEVGGDPAGEAPESGISPRPPRLYTDNDFDEFDDDDFDDEFDDDFEDEDEDDEDLDDDEFEKPSK